MSMKKGLNRKLPPNASRGHKRLAEILNSIFHRDGADMTIIYEQSLADLSEPDVVDDYQVNGMTVDFYIRELNMAVEYQGEQHYKESSSGFYTGQTSRDIRKRAFLEDIGVTLKEIPWRIGDEFTEDDVRDYLGLL